MVMQDATFPSKEVWNETSWSPVFALTVKRYQELICSTQAPEAFQASMYSCLKSIVALDLQSKRFAGNLAYGAYVDDVLLEKCSHIPEVNIECLPSEDKGLCNTFLAGVFQKPDTKWVACLCCGTM